MNEETCGVRDCLAVFCKVLARADNLGQFTMRQTDGFPAVARENDVLSARFGFGVCFEAKELSPLAVRSKID